MNKMKLAKDIWNLFISNIPSRRVRQFWLKQCLKSIESKAFFCLHTHIMEPANISIGQRSIINANCLLDGREAHIDISNDVDIGTGTHIWTLEHDPNDPEHATKSGAVVIEDHVWIASRVTILPGVTIGRGAVVAAGSIVTKNVESMAIVAGVPAKQIGIRSNPLTYQLNFSPRFR